MSKVGSIIAVAGGSTAVFALAYVAVATVSGAPIGKMPPFAWFQHEEQHADPSGHAAEPVATATAAHSEHADAAATPVVPSMTAGVLGAFVLPSPFDSRELAELEKGLRQRQEAIELREKELLRRAAELDDWQKDLEGRLRELDALRAETGQAPSTPPADKEDTAAGGARADEASWRNMAPLFEEGDVDELAGKLADFTPDEAAGILKGLEPERAAALLNALPKAKYKPFLDAWRRAKD